MSKARNNRRQQSWQSIIARQSGGGEVPIGEWLRLLLMQELGLFFFCCYDKGDKIDEITITLA